MEQPPVLRRLHALSERGYAAQFGGKEQPDAVFLLHPARVRYRSLHLYEDGTVVGRGLRLDADDEQEFDEFVRSVPTPTLWDRYGPKSIAYGVFYGFVAFGTVIALWLTGALMSALKNIF